MTDTVTALTLDERKGQYDAELRRAGIAFAAANPTVHWQHVTAVVDKYYKGKKGDYRRCMALVERKCGKSAGFPRFEEWAP